MLAALFRALVAIRFNLFAVLAQVKGHVDNDAAFEAVEKDVRVQKRRWRADEAVWIASADVLLAGVSYLL